MEYLWIFNIVEDLAISNRTADSCNFQPVRRILIDYICIFFCHLFLSTIFEATSMSNMFPSIGHFWHKNPTNPPRKKSQQRECILKNNFLSWIDPIFSSSLYPISPSLPPLPSPPARFFQGFSERIYIWFDFFFFKIFVLFLIYIYYYIYFLIFVCFLILILWFAESSLPGVSFSQNRKTETLFCFTWWRFGHNSWKDSPFLFGLLALLPLWQKQQRRVPLCWVFCCFCFTILSKVTKTIEKKTK